MAVIETSKLGLNYGDRRGIEDISLRISEGQIYGFLGSNGAGKTTTIRILLGFLRPSQGQAAIFGMDCWSHSRCIKQEVGYVPGDVRLYPWLTVERGLKLAQTLRGRPLFADGLALCEKLQLDPTLPVRKMSRGNRQKVALVLALVHKPKLIVMDEPTSGLDPVIQAMLMQLLREVASEGRTVLFSSHTLSEVEQLCNHVLMIRNGRIVVDQRLESLRSNAPRTVRLVARSGVALNLESLPDNVRLINHSKDDYELVLTGTARELVNWMSFQPIEDISIGPPLLDRLFHNHYTHEAEE
jgi:ABC-2 type transport system ATP-binding protein